MRHSILSVLPFLALGGCALSDIDHNFSHIVGKPVDQITRKLGQPTGVYEASEVQVVEWKLRRRDPVVRAPLGLSTFGTPWIGSGYVAGTSYGDYVPSLTSLSMTMPRFTPGSETNLVPQLTGYSVCKVRIATDDNHTVLDYQFEGDINACYSVSRSFTKKG